MVPLAMLGSRGNGFGIGLKISGSGLLQVFKEMFTKKVSPEQNAQLEHKHCNLAFVRKYRESKKTNLASS